MRFNIVCFKHMIRYKKGVYKSEVFVLKQLKPCSFSPAKIFICLSSSSQLKSGQLFKCEKQHLHTEKKRAKMGGVGGLL